MFAVCVLLLTMLAMVAGWGGWCTVDVLGVVMECTEPNTFTSKAGKEMTKRTMQLADTSGRAIECTIFGQPSKNIVAGNAVAIKAAKVGSWNGKSLTLWEDASVTIHPDMQEAHSLLGWWQTQQQSGQGIISLSTAGGGNGGGSKPARRIVFGDIDEQALGLNAEPDYFEVKCTITFIKTEGRTLWYIACPNCKKKLGGAQEEDLQVRGHSAWLVSARRLCLRRCCMLRGFCVRRRPLARDGAAMRGAFLPGPFAVPL